jgi:helicase
MFGGDLTLSPPQVTALDKGILNANNHFLVSAPTNSGKTLVAILRIFHRALAHGGRFVYVAPLKALAEEKVTEFRTLASLIAISGGRAISVEISTGDYRISGDFPDSPPPGNSEILVCTPERLEVILRNPSFHDWARSVDTYVLDEFHMLGQGERGARFETLVTRLLIACPCSTLVALSATFGSIDSVAAWLGEPTRPTLVVESNYRYPLLRRQLVTAPDKDSFIANLMADIKDDDERSLIVFVYRKSDAERLAKTLDHLIGGERRAVAFHSGLSIRLKKHLAAAFRNHKVKVLVCTTTLAMGVNTPATDVVVRDTVFHGYGRLSISDIQQMTGRAGRGDRQGVATILFQDNEDWSKYATDLNAGRIDALHPQLMGLSHYRDGKKDTTKHDRSNSLATALLTEIASKNNVGLNDIDSFVLRTYSAHCASVSSAIIRSTVDSLDADKLIYRLENSEATYAATRLGRTTSVSGLSARSGAIFGAFLRAMINLSEKQRAQNASAMSVLHRITDLDLLVLCLASFEARQMLLPIQNDQRQDIDQYIEQLLPEDKPVLNLWRDPNSEFYPTRRLISTLRLSNDKASGDQIIFWRLLRTGSMLLEHARGRKIADLAQTYRCRDGDIEGRLKPAVCWLLNALAQICSSDRCYKLDFLAIRAYELMQAITVGGPLGKLMYVKGIGIKTIETLSASGIQDLSELSAKPTAFLEAMGLGKSQMEALRRFLVRRRR